MTWPKSPMLGTLLVVVSVAMCGACAHVAPYQRERLAHPTMQMTDMAGPAAAHVNHVQEGATGGAIGAASGCGCN